MKKKNDLFNKKKIRSNVCPHVRAYDVQIPFAGFTPAPFFRNIVVPILMDYKPYDPQSFTSLFVRYYALTMSIQRLQFVASYFRAL